MFANRHDIRGYLRAFGPDTPNLQAAAATLANLADWADLNSDGWAYWPKPCRAAKRLQELLYDADLRAIRSGDDSDIAAAELAAAYRPIKAFRTRQSADFTIEEPS